MIIVANPHRLVDECYKSISLSSSFLEGSIYISMKFAEILQHRIMIQDSRTGINLAEQLSFVPRAQ